MMFKDKVKQNLQKDELDSQLKNLYNKSKKFLNTRSGGCVNYLHYQKYVEVLKVFNEIYEKDM